MDITAVPPMVSTPSATPPKPVTAAPAATGGKGSGDGLTSVQRKELAQQQVEGRDAVDLIKAASPYTYPHRHHLDVVG